MKSRRFVAFEPELRGSNGFVEHWSIQPLPFDGDELSLEAPLLCPMKLRTVASGFCRQELDRSGRLAGERRFCVQEPTLT